VVGYCLVLTLSDGTTVRANLLPMLEHLKRENRAMTPARQLTVFHGKRQRGTVPPAASKYQLHCAVVQRTPRAFRSA
jgi:hypothetical protein